MAVEVFYHGTTTRSTRLTPLFEHHTSHAYISVLGSYWTPSNSHVKNRASGFTVVLRERHDCIRADGNKLYLELLGVHELLILAPEI
jgi:hypothetical protein